MQAVTMKDLAPLEELFEQAHSEMFRDFATCVFMQLLEDSKILPSNPPRGSVVAGTALRIANRLVEVFGGRQMYVTKGVKVKNELRNREMYLLFDGRKWNYKTLSIKYGLSEMQVRNVISYMAKKEREARSQNMACAA